MKKDKRETELFHVNILYFSPYALPTSKASLSTPQKEEAFIPHSLPHNLDE
jgi:hypothetical protein